MDIQITTISEDHAQALEELQRVCFPTLSDNELMRAEHFRSHARLFPEGNFVVVADNKIVGLGSGFLTEFDFDHPDHTFQEIIAEGFYTNHDPDGDYYYGGDISVHPEYRRRGIGSKLYEARKNLVIERKLKGIVAGGLIPGYADHKTQLTPQAYVDKVVAGELYDSTLSFQLKHGFIVRSLLQDYIEDNASDNWATLIVWENPNFTR